MLSSLYYNITSCAVLQYIANLKCVQHPSVGGGLFSSRKHPNFEEPREKNIRVVDIFIPAHFLGLLSTLSTVLQFFGHSELRTKSHGLVHYDEKFFVGLYVKFRLE